MVIPKFSSIKLLYILFSLIHAPMVLSQSHPSRFCYEDSRCNPDVWPGICQTGTQQSPINLPGSQVETLQSRYLIFNKGYSSSIFYVQNDGRTLSVTFSPNHTSSGRMSGFDLRVPYIFASAHLHWGNFKKPYIGSEHSIYGTFYPMEMHFVHYSSNYDSVSDAIASGDPQGLAVVGVFIEPEEKGASRDFNIIARQVKSRINVSVSETHEEVYDLLDLSSFLPKHGDGCFRYQGSLTTPGCNEQVIWTVLSTRVIPVHPKAFQAFSRLKNSEGLPIRNNFRPLIKDSKDRKVKYFRLI